ncbi:PhnD/SsuA/transferrin family substrate-binding protein [Psychrobacter sp. LV10R520-6]|uniref:PhnD/SsuA/transferrin family substrate-binding protein n=1 Tax=Psychrobacter sp. LV10R520-6 TaxID=1415574 RepID=UPI0024C8AFC4|nr:PhnD/SsuA/transferrin family substrate-binding protein [Psychrobacter sp. LV10R520-6]SNT70143.1 two-component system, LuxR family, sensor histidine kinase TtrS [Psychrobacter sp. LV10R520-6]
MRQLKQQMWIIRYVPVRVVFALISVLMVAFTVVLLPLTKANAQTYYLGVLAPQGETAAQQRWQPWLSQLNNKLKSDTVVLVPLALENWQQQIEAQQFALVLGPQVQFIKMETMGWRWLATLQANPQTSKANEFKISDVKQADFKTDEQYKLYKQLENELALSKQAKADKSVNQPSAMEQIGSALWVKADSDIQQLRDLQQRKIVAVDPDAFGGYLLIAHLLQQNGVLPSDYETQFVGYPIELTLSALASGAVDSAIAPLCLMEEMAGQGKIEQSQYRLINPVMTDSNCQSSTKIYPNWTLAATSQAPAALTEQINQHLFTGGQRSTDRDTNPIENIAELRWLAPESSVDAERILYEMNRHPAQKQLGAYVFDWIKSHRVWVGLIFFIIIISSINYGWMSWLAWRRRQQIVIQNQLIRDYDYKLQQSERFAVIGEMSGAIAHEINQPLATIQNYAQGLLIRSQNTRFDKDSSEKEALNTATVNKENLEKEALKKEAVEKEKVESALQQIVSETERAAGVIKNIRHWAGRSQPDEVSVDIAATYQQCIMLLGEKAEGITFWFASDYQQLQLPSLLLDQLLINSMLNAQQQGATHIMLRCQMTEYEGMRWLALYVTDDAGGFDDARLMNNESQDKSHSYSNSQYGTRSTKADGLGLGLMICQRLCKSLDGTMQLSNVNVRHELINVKSINGRYQHRSKRSLYSKAHLTQTDGVHPLTHETGAQVTLYLPIHLLDDNGADTDMSADKI